MISGFKRACLGSQIMTTQRLACLMSIQWCRAPCGGVSVRINLNRTMLATGNASIARFGPLVRGGPPPIDLPFCGRRIDGFPANFCDGFMERHRDSKDLRYCVFGEW